MASQVLARRFSTKLHKSCSLYSPFPLSRLNHPIDQSLSPKNSVISSFSSIFNRNYNSTPYFSNSTNIISKSCIKSSHPWKLCKKARYFSSSESKDDKKKLLVDNDDELSKYFSSKEGKEFIDKLSKGKYVSSDHQEFVDQLPKDFNDITPEDLCKGSKILVKSLANVSKDLTTVGFISIVIAAVTSNNMPQITIPFFLIGCMSHISSLKERKAMEKVRLLMQEQQQQGNNVQIQALFLQLLQELKKSDDRDFDFKSFVFVSLLSTTYWLVLK